MMSERNVFSTPTSWSRLSPLARPFALSNPFNRHESFDPLLDCSSSWSTSSLDQPFSFLNLGTQGHGHGYHAYHSDATAITAFPYVDDLYFEPNSPSAYYPLEEPPVDTHFSLPAHQSSQTSFIPSSSSLGNVGPKSGVKGTAVGQQGRGIPYNKDQIGSTAGSLSCNDWLEQGTIFEGSKLVCESSTISHGQGSGVIGKDHQIRPEEKDKIHTESNIFRLANSEVNLLNRYMTNPFSISLDISCSSRPQDTQSKLSYSAPLGTSSHFDSMILNDGRCFPDLGSFGVETLVSCSPDSFTYSAQIFKPSSAGLYRPSVGPIPLENVASGSSVADSNRDSYFSYVVPSVIDTDIVQNHADKVACHDLVIIETGEKRKIAEPVQNETKNPSIMAKSKLQIACLKVPKDLSLEQHGAKAGMPDDKSSTNHDDSDVDSPCWKGTQAYKSPFRDSVPLSSVDSKDQYPPRVLVSLKSERLKNEKVARNSLNPLAPVFIPGNSTPKMDNHHKECHGDSSSASQKIAALAVTSSKDYRLMNSVEASSCPSERINDIGMHCCNDGRDSRKEDGIPYKSSRSSVVNSSCSLQPSLKEEHVTSESQLLRGTKVAGSMGDIADATHNGPNTSISFLTTEIVLNSHSTTGVGVFSDFTERFQETANSTPPKIDVQLIINTIKYMSELLLHSSSLSLGSLSEHDNDKLLNVINSLYVVIRNRADQMAVRPESHHLCTEYGQQGAADHHKVAKVKDKAVLHVQEMHEKSAPNLCSRKLRSYQSGTNEGFEKGNDINQVIEKNPKVIHLIEHEMPSEALFYRKLWLEAKAALYIMQSQAHALHMKSEPDRC